MAGPAAAPAAGAVPGDVGRRRSTVREPARLRRRPEARAPVRVVSGQSAGGVPPATDAAPGAAGGQKSDRQRRGAGGRRQPVGQTNRLVVPPLYTTRHDPRKRRGTMKLIKLALRNFKGIRDFTLQLDGADASVYADNGVGKTTLLDAWTWLLFG